MTKIPSLAYPKLIRALQRDGRVVVRQKGSHIRFQKHTESETLNQSSRVFACPAVGSAKAGAPPSSCDLPIHITSSQHGIESAAPGRVTLMAAARQAISRHGRTAYPRIRPARK